MISEADILTQIVLPDEPGLPPALTQSVLELRFSADAIRQMNALAEKNNRGTITASEHEDLQRYLRVGQMLDLIQARAKQSLQQGNGNG